MNEKTRKYSWNNHGKGNKGKNRTAVQRHAESQRLKGKEPQAATKAAKD